jgi:hypothetical protein
MKTLTGQKNLTARSSVVLLLNYCQCNLFVKRCDKYKAAEIVRKNEAFSVIILIIIIIIIVI